MSTTTEAGHTPTPYRIDGTELIHGLSDSGPVKFAVIRSSSERWIALVELEDEESHANAAFIVEACNNHTRLKSDVKALREALKFARPYVQYRSEHPLSAVNAGSARADLAIIDAALDRSTPKP